jgi:hypothetical protein
MKHAILAILCACLCGCATPPQNQAKPWRLPKIALSLGFMGATIGIQVGSDPQPDIINLPAPTPK